MWVLVGTAQFLLSSLSKGCSLRCSYLENMYRWCTYLDDETHADMVVPAHVAVEEPIARVLRTKPAPDREKLNV
jgi:hypothetical protein